MADNGGTVVGQTTGKTYQLWNLDFDQVEYYETGDAWTGSTGVATLPDAPSGQSYTSSGSNTYDETAVASTYSGSVQPTSLHTFIASDINGVSDKLTGDFTATFTGIRFNGVSNICSIAVDGNIILRIGAAASGLSSIYFSTDNFVTSTTVHTFSTSSSTQYTITLRLKWITSGATTDLYYGYSATATLNATPNLPSLTGPTTITALIGIAPEILTFSDDGQAYAQWGGGGRSSYYPINAQLNTPSPPQSAYPWRYFKQQLVKVYDPNGNFINVWSDAPLLDGFKEAIQSVTSPMRVKLPRRFDNFDEVGTTGALGTVGQGNIVKWYLFGPGLPSNGLLRYEGVIDAYEPTINDDGQEFVTVTVTPRGSAVGDNALIGLQNFGTPGHPGTYLDPVTMFTHWFQVNDPLIAHTYTYPLILDPTNPGSSGVVTQYSFLNQQLNDIFDTILLLLPPNWFWRINVDNTVTLNQSPVTPQHTFILGRHCVSLLYTQDWTQLKNNVFVQGGNNPDTGLPISASAVGTDLDVYGNRALLIQETRIVDQATADAYAHGLLTVSDQVQYRAQLRIFDYRGDPNVGLGYDIETIKVGQTCTVIAPQITVAPPVPPAYWDQGFWDIMYWDSAPSGGAPAVPSLWDQMIWERDYWDTSPPSVSGGESLWDQMVWDQDDWDTGPGNALGQVVQITALTYGFNSVDLELSALRPSQDVALARLQAKLQSVILS